MKGGKNYMNTKNILLILLIIVLLITTIIITTAVVTTMGNSSTYERVNLSSTCSLELPKVHFDESNDGGSSSYGGITVNMKSKVLSNNDLVISYLKTTDNSGFSSDSVYTGNSQFNVAHQDWYSRDISNSATGETISIMGKNKEQVDHIADSIRFAGGDNNTNNTTSQTTNNQQNALAYKSDGTPMYSQSEVDNYVNSKYGSVNYHTQSNGYIALDDPSYTSDGHYVGSSGNGTW